MQPAARRRVNRRVMLPAPQLTVVLPLVALVLIAARKADDPKYEKHYTTAGPSVSPAVSVALNGSESQATFIQLGAKFTNTTADQLVIVNKSSGQWILPQGAFPVVQGTVAGFFGPNMLIGPGETKGSTFRAEGASGFQVDNATFRFGEIWSAPNASTPMTVSDFQLPPARNDFGVEGWACKVLKHEQDTDLTQVQFACTYSGKGLGIIEPAHISVKAPNGQMFANLAKKARREIVMVGDTAKFPLEVTMPVSVCDMQFSTLQVVFNDAIGESPLSAVTLPDWALTLDAAATTEANK